MTTDQVQARMSLLKPTMSYADLGQADLIIEAVFETMVVKKDVIGRLDTRSEARGYSSLQYILSID